MGWNEEKGRVAFFLYPYFVLLDPYAFCLWICLCQQLMDLSVVE